MCDLHDDKQHHEDHGTRHTVRYDAPVLADVPPHDQLCLSQYDETPAQYLMQSLRHQGKVGPPLSSVQEIPCEFSAEGHYYR